MTKFLVRVRVSGVEGHTELYAKDADEAKIKAFAMLPAKYRILRDIVFSIETI